MSDRPLDRPIRVSIFRDLAATDLQSIYVSLPEFAEQLRSTRAATKEALPLFSAAAFGGRRSSKGSLRADGNLRQIYAVVGDYDGETTSIDEAAEALRQANIAALIVTTPSHTEHAPRWRAVAPLAWPLHHATASHDGRLVYHGQLTSRLAGVLPDGLAAESWNKSQAWYLGTVDSAPAHRVILVEGDHLDLRPDLDATARAKPTPPTKIRAPRGTRARRATPIPTDPAQLDLVDYLAATTTAIPDEALPLDLQDALAAIAAGSDSHAAVVALAGKLASQDVPQDVAIALLTGAADQRPPEQRDKGWQAMRADIPRTVAWAHAKETESPPAAGGNGMLPPAPPPPPGGAPGVPPAGPTPPDLDIDASVPPAYSDEQLALTFAEQYADRLRYVAAWAQWFAWDGKVWRQDDTLRVFSRVRLLLRQAAASCPKRRVAGLIASARTVAAVERLARADRRLAAAVEQWDTDPNLLNTPAGMVDLRTGQLRPHRADCYATKITSVAPGGPCPTWYEFLDKITGGDRELQAYLQRVAGYALTGDTSEHALFFAYGTGSNGKTTFVNTLTALMGSYAAVAAMETFIAAPTDQHPCDLAMLRGARLVTAQETADGRRWNESRIKAMTGGDPITARFMRQDFFTYVPNFKLFVAGNHRPGLRSVNEAIRRRLNLVPFSVTILQAERDRALPGRLRAEGPGILAWAVAGCLAWRQAGLAPPQAVTAATDDYLGDEDLIQAWIDEHCIVNQRQASFSSTLYSAFRAWAELTGEHVPTHRWFVGVLTDRGFRRGRARDQYGGQQRTITGLMLISGAGLVPP